MNIDNDGYSLLYGYKKEGILKFVGFAKTKLGANSGIFDNLEIKVYPNKDVLVTLNGEPAKEKFKANFSTRGYGGAIVATGFNSVVEFRNYDVAPIPFAP